MGTRYILPRVMVADLETARDMAMSVGFVEILTIVNNLKETHVVEDEIECLRLLKEKAEEQYLFHAGMRGFYRSCQDAGARVISGNRISEMYRQVLARTLDEGGESIDPEIAIANPEQRPQYIAAVARIRQMMADLRPVDDDATGPPEPSEVHITVKGPEGVQ